MGRVELSVRGREQSAFKPSRRRGARVLLGEAGRVTAGHAAGAVTDGDYRLMLQLCDQLERAVDDGNLIDALNLDEEILGILYVASGNQVLVESIRGLWQRCRAYKIRGADRARALSDRSLWSFQPRIVAAAQNRDGESAAEITRESMLSAMDRIRATFAAER